jgi:hypothetical protein
MTQTDQSNTDLKLLNELAMEASLVLSDGKVTFGEIVHLGGILAGKVNQLAHLSGQQKKELVIKSVEEGLKLVLDLKKASLPDDFEKKISDAAAFVKETLPAVLDLACDVANGKLDLKKPVVKKTCISLFSLLFRCIKAPVPVEPLVVAVPLVVSEPLALPLPKEEPKPQASSDSESKQSLEVSEQVLETRPANTVTE